MDLYLMQHGEAMAEADDPARPLTDAGRTAVRKVVVRVAAAGVRVDSCVHSGRLRAEQTAQILADAISSPEAVRPREGMAPNDPVQPTADWLRGLGPDGAVAVVGHLPFLARLSALLVTGEESRQVVQFRMGGLVKLVPVEGSDNFAVGWSLPPELA